MPEPFILMCAPNGARRLKADHSALPINPAEIAACAEEVYETGASILHLHVRDPDGKHSLDPEYYLPAIDAVRKLVGRQLIIQVTTEAVGQYMRDEQKEVVKAVRPEAVSFALREICGSEDLVLDTADFFGWMRAENIFPQIILYDEQDVTRFMGMKRRGVFATDKPFVLCVLGRHEVEASGKLEGFAANLSAESVPWAVCGFGENEHGLPALAAKLGGHVRVGFENNIWRQDGTLAVNNAELVTAAKDAVERSGRTLAKADDVREMFALAKM